MSSRRDEKRARSRGIGGLRHGRSRIDSLDCPMYSSDVVDGLPRKRSPIVKKLLVSLRTRLVGGKKSAGSEAAVQIRQIGRAGHDVVVCTVWIGSQSKSSPVRLPGLRHDLHEAHRAGTRGRRASIHGLTTRALCTDDGVEQRRRESESICRFMNDRLPSRSPTERGPVGGDGAAATKTAECGEDRYGNEQFVAHCHVQRGIARPMIPRPVIGPK